MKKLGGFQLQRCEYVGVKTRIPLFSVDGISFSFIALSTWYGVRKTLQALENKNRNRTFSSMSVTEVVIEVMKPDT